MLDQAPVALGLALLGAPQHSEQFTDRRLRDQCLEIGNRVGDVFQVDMKIGARVTEQVADFRFREHDIVEHHAILGVPECEDDRLVEASPFNAADHIGTRELVEHRVDHLDRQHIIGISGELRGNLRNCTLIVAQRHRQLHSLEQRVQQRLQGSVPEVPRTGNLPARTRQRIKIRGNEFDIRRDAHGAK